MISVMETSLAALRGSAPLIRSGAPFRSPELKLVVTSATLDSDKFSAYYGGCPVLTVPGRCHPVTVVHARENHDRDHLQVGLQLCSSRLF